LHVLVDRPTQYSSVAVAKSIHFDVAASSYQNTAPAQLADRFHVVRVYLKNARRPETIALLKGAYDGDEEMVMLALRQYASIEAKDERMRTSLALATENGHQGIVKLLLQNGANVNARDNQEYTPLHRAILRDQKEIAEMLLDAHADKETVDADNCLTPLLTAIAVNSPDLCRLLVQKRADIEATVGAHDTVKSVTGALPPLHRAVQEGHLNIVQLLVEAGAHKDRKIPPMQLTPLLIAVNRGLLDIALYLITEGADIHAENSVGWNALRCAVESRNVSMVRMLLDKRVPLREAGQMYRQSNDEVMKEVIFNAAMEVRMGCQGAPVGERLENQHTPTRTTTSLTRSLQQRRSATWTRS
jgi:ankyrin repeat protein